MRLPRWQLGWLLSAGVLLLGACDTKAKEQLTKKLDEATDNLLACKKENSELSGQIAALKNQLATAVANPDRIVLTDPEIINLVASIREQAGVDPLGKGALDPRVASKIVMDGAPALRQCYERALKKNESLQYRSDLGVTLGITVQPQGTVENVGVSPSVDEGMTTCIKNAARRWKFPKFAGRSVTIEQKLTLTPTKT